MTAADQIAELERKRDERLRLIDSEYRERIQRIMDACTHDWNRAPFIKGIGQVRGNQCAKCGLWEPFPSTQST